MARILIADDDEANRLLMVTLLGHFGHELLVAVDGEQALALIGQSPPDIIVTDLRMPRVDGFELARRLRADPATASIPLVLCSANYSDRLAHELAREVGSATLMVKPIDIHQMLQMVRDLAGDHPGAAVAAPAPELPAASDEHYRDAHLRLLTDALAVQLDRLGDLINLGWRLTGPPAVPDLLELVCRSARAVVRAEGAAIALFGESPHAVEHVAFDGDAAAGVADTPAAAWGAWLARAQTPPPRPYRLRRSPDGGMFPDEPPGFARARSFLSVPIFQAGETCGWLWLMNKVSAEVFSEEDQALATTIASQTAVALENSRLHASLTERNADLERLTRRLVEVQESERRHIARELHDEVGQALTALTLTLAGAESADGAGRDRRIGDARDMLQDLIDRVRQLSLDLRPAMLDDFGLLPTLEWYTGRFATQTGVQVRFLHRGVADRRFPADVETGAFRVIQEALTNVARHARVSEASVRVVVTGDSLSVHILDLGRGFDPEEALAAGRTGGVLGMRERAALLGGSLSIVSAPGRGTRLRCLIPLGRPDAAQEAVEHDHHNRPW